MDGGDEVLPVGPLVGVVPGEVAVQVHDDEERVHRDVGVGVAALPHEAIRGVKAPVVDIGCNNLGSGNPDIDKKNRDDVIYKDTQIMVYTRLCGT